MDDDIGEMVRTLYGPSATAASIEGPPLPAASAAATPSEAANKVNVPDISMTETADGGGGDQTDMGVTHYQCMAARAAKSQVEATSIAADATFGKTVKLDAEQIGLLNPPGEKEVDKTFRGARVKRGGDTVNQSVTMTIDPCNMYCINCAVEHPILQNQNKPVVIILSDQNFVPVWPNTTKDSCVVVIRMSNPDLHELFDLLFEVLDRNTLPDGSMILASSVSYLHRVGTSYYAKDWTQVVHKVGKRMPNVRVCPLPPLIRANCSGGVARELIELGGWFASVYKNSPQGLLEVWNSLATITIERSAGQTTLNAVEAYTISLPSSLEPGAPDKPTTLYTNSSRPSVLFGIDQGTVCGLLHTLAIVLDRDFKIPVGAGLTPASTGTAEGVQEHVKRVVLIGASNLKRVASELQREGLEVIDLCTPGWTVTPANVQKLTNTLKNSNMCQNSAFVYDLYGNSCFRATLFDGSTVMPTKEGGGGYHLPGSVEVCKDDIFCKLIEIAQPVLDIVEDSIKVVIPPQPRYLFAPCCSDRSHCSNVGQGSHAETLLAGCFRLRAILKRKMVASGSQNPPWVMDTCCSVPNAPECTVVEKLSVLKRVSSHDGVHLTSEGNSNVAKNICDTLANIQTGMLGKKIVLSRSSAVPLAGAEPNFFWKGFNSPVGSSKRLSQSWGKFPREKPHGNSTPYKRWGRGGRSFWRN